VRLGIDAAAACRIPGHLSVMRTLAHHPRQGAAARAKAGGAGCQGQCTAAPLHTALLYCALEQSAVAGQRRVERQRRWRGLKTLLRIYRILFCSKLLINTLPLFHLFCEIKLDHGHH